MKSTTFKSADELTKDNPKGLDTLKSPHNFSSNPGFIGPVNNGAMPLGRHVDSAPRVTPRATFGSTPPRGTMRSAAGVRNSGPGATDPKMDGGPFSVTSGFNG